MSYKPLIWKTFWVGLLNKYDGVWWDAHHGDISPKGSYVYLVHTCMCADWPDVAPWQHPPPVCHLSALAHSHAQSGLTYSWPRPEIAWRPDLIGKCSLWMVVAGGEKSEGSPSLSSWSSPREEWRRASAEVAHQACIHVCKWPHFKQVLKTNFSTNGCRWIGIHNLF